MDYLLPENYEPPKSNGSYTKLEEGDTKIRILSQPLLGWIDWIDKKGIRFKYDEPPKKPHDPKKPIKHFWSMIVWNYSTEKIEILEITQSGIRKEIINLNNCEDWGAPYFYDIKINKKGEGMNTEYCVTPIPHKPLPAIVREEFNSKPCNLDALMSGLDPFAAGQDSYTPGIFSKEDLPHKKQVVRFPSADDIKFLNKLLSTCPEGINKDMEKWMLENNYMSKADIPAQDFFAWVEKAQKLKKVSDA